MSAQNTSSNRQLCLALGDFILAFSQLCGILEYVALYLICRSGPQTLYDRTSASISELTAKPLSNIVFSLIVQAGPERWSADDLAIIKTYRKELDALIEERNRIVHDVWASASVEPNEEMEELWKRRRRRLSPKTGVYMQYTSVTVSDLEIQSKRARELFVVIQNIAVTSTSDIYISLARVVDAAKKNI